MDIPGQTVIEVLRLLLPGFITAAFLYSLTPAPRPIPFERIVQALIFTMVVQGGVMGVQSSLVEMGTRVGTIGEWTTEVGLAWSPRTFTSVRNHASNIFLIGMVRSAIPDSWIHRPSPVW